MVSGEVSVFAEVLRLSSTADAADPVAAVGKLCVKDLEEIRKMHKPSAVVRRTLEATFLLLNLPKADARPVPPTWERIQRMLADMSFLTRMKAYDADSLRNSPAVASFIAEEYFGAPSARRSSTPPDGRRHTVAAARTVSKEKSARVASPARLARSSTVLLRAGRSVAVFHEPLTYQRVLHASHAAGALFSWCTATIEEAMNPEPAAPPGPTPAELALKAAEEEALRKAAEEEAAKKAADKAAAEAAAKQEPEPASPFRTLTAVPAPASEPEPASPFRPRKQETGWTPPPKAPPPQPEPSRPAAAGPDRHFEQISVFKLGYSEITPEGEMALQLVAATMCMRQQLVLQLQGALHPMENPAMVTTRQRYVENFFDENKLRYQASEQPIKQLGMDGDPGIICQLVLDRDRELRDWFIMRDEGEAFKIGANTRCVVESLEHEFKTIKH